MSSILVIGDQLLTPVPQKKSFPLVLVPLCKSSVNENPSICPLSFLEFVPKYLLAKSRPEDGTLSVFFGASGHGLARKYLTFLRERYFVTNRQFILVLPPQMARRRLGENDPYRLWTPIFPDSRVGKNGGSNPVVGSADYWNTVSYFVNVKLFWGLR